MSRKKKPLAKKAKARLASTAVKPAKGAKGMKPTKAPTSDLAQLRNIGRTIQRRLLAVDISSEKQLRKVGAVDAYQLIREKFAEESIPVCYYLYSLQGALMNCHWDALPDETKKRLRRRAGVE